MNVTSRAYAGAADFARLQAFLAHARTTVSDTHCLHTGDLTWQLFHMLADFDPAQLVRVWEDEQHGLIGFVLLQPRFGGLDLQLDPAWRSEPLVIEMLGWAEMQLQQEWPRDQCMMSMLVNQRDSLLQGVLTRCGFAPGGEWLYMRRALVDPIAVIAPPSGWSVRNLRSADEAAARAAVLGLAFEAPPFVVWYQKLMWSPGYDMNLDLVAVAPDGHFGAFANVWVDPVNKVGQFEPVGTAPEDRRLGLAQAVVSEGLHRMQLRGMETALVIVEAAEQAACRLYASVGFETAWQLDWYQQAVSSAPTGAFNSNTSHLQLHYSNDAAPDLTSNMILKRNISEPWGIEAGAQEVAFDTLVAALPAAPPAIVPCYVGDRRRRRSRRFQPAAGMPSLLKQAI